MTIVWIVIPFSIVYLLVVGYFSRPRRKFSKPGLPGFCKGDGHGKIGGSVVVVAKQKGETFSAERTSHKARFLAGPGVTRCDSETVV